MYYFYFALIFLDTVIIRECAACSVRGVVMDCSSELLEDCPGVNESVTELIMNDNRVKDLRRGNCGKWTFLRVLRVRGNQVKQMMDFTVLKYLRYIDVSHNELERVLLAGDMIVTADLSYNRLVNVTVEGTASLETLLLSHNSLSRHSLHNILINQALPSLKTIDLSYNNFSSVPLKFMTFFPTYLTHINLAGNRISHVYFTLFTYKIHESVSLNLSHNLITTLILSAPPSIDVLDLSYNRLSFLDNNSLVLLLSIPTLDFSNNPYNCSCETMPPYITWMRENKDIFINQQDTNCSFLQRLNIFYSECPSSLLLVKQHWVLRTIIVAGVIIVLGGIILVIVCLKLKKPSIDPSKCHVTWSRISSIFPACIRKQEVTGYNKHVQGCSTESLPNDHLDFEDKLIILCSSKDSEWIEKDIAVNLKIYKHIISCTVPHLPLTEFILIVVNGDQSLNDPRFTKNVTLALELNDSVELRLLVRNLPGINNIKTKNIFFDYIKSCINNNSYINFEEGYPSQSINSIKAWLNLVD